MKRPYFLDREPVGYLGRPAPCMIPVWFALGALGLGFLAGLLLGLIL